MYEIELEIGQGVTVVPYPFILPAGTKVEIAITPNNGQAAKPVTYKVEAEVTDCTFIG